MAKNIKIHIAKPFSFTGDDRVRVYAVYQDEAGETKRVVTVDGTDGRMKLTDVPKDSYGELPALFTLDEEFFSAFILAAIQYADENHIASDDERLVTGKLLATERHLEDFRHLYFGDRGIGLPETNTNLKS